MAKKKRRKRKDQAPALGFRGTVNRPVTIKRSSKMGIGKGITKI